MKSIKGTEDSKRKRSFGGAAQPILQKSISVHGHIVSVTRQRAGCCRCSHTARLWYTEYGFILLSNKEKLLIDRLISKPTRTQQWETKTDQNVLNVKR